MNYVFILERYNDLDMLTPIIWKCATRKGANVVIVNAQPDRTSSDDFRLQFLCQSPRVTYIQVGLQPTDGALAKAKHWWLDKVYFKRLNKMPQTKHRADLALFDFDSIPLRQNSPTLVVVAYQVGHPAVEQACSWAQYNSYATVLVQHGACPLMVSDDLVSDAEPSSSFDAVFINTENALKLLPWANEEQVRFVGSPRFSEEWSTVYDSILPMQETGGSGPFTVLFMLSKWKDKDDQAAVVECMRHFAAQKNVKVIVKPHTRGMDFKDIVGDNVVVADESLHSRALIRQSDVIMFTRSSIFIDALLLDKPLVRISYATKSDLATDVLSQCFAHCLADVKKQVALVQQGHRTYSPEAREQCLQYYAGSNYDDDVIDTYVDALSAVAIKKQT